MSNATARNFATRERERARRVGRSLEGEMPLGSLAVTGDPGWDTFFGALHDQEQAARGAGMGFRADLGDIGRYDMPTEGGGRLTATDRAGIAGNVGLAGFTDANAARQIAIKRAVDQQRDAAVADAQGAYQQHVMDSVAQPAVEEPVTLGSTGANGEPRYTMRNLPSAHPLSQRQKLLQRMPGSMAPAVDAALAPLEQRDRAQELAERQQTEAERHAPVAERIAEAATRTRKPLTQTSEAALINKMSADWTKANTTNKEMDRQFQIMKTGLDRFDADPNGASQAVLVTFQKMLDPESVVRESEYARSSQGIGLMGRMQGYIEKLARGGAGVPKADLEQMVKTAEQFKQNTQDAPERARKRLEATADRYEIPHEMIFGGATGPSGGGMVKLRAPDGTTREVPADQAEHYVAKGAKRVQ